MTSFASKTTVVFFAASSLLTACGDDGSSGNPDACLGGGNGGAPATCGPWAEDVPEGGDVRIELQKDGTSGATTLAAHAYFFKNQMPIRRDLEGPEVVPGSRCHDMKAGVYFDNGAPAPAVALVDTRTYVEAGANVTFKASGQTITLDKLANTMELSSYLTHDIVYMPASSDGTSTPRNQPWEVEWPGAEIPVTDLNSEEASPVSSVGAKRVESQLFVPADITDINPSFAAPLSVPATGDWAFTFAQAASPAGAPPLETFFGFYNPETGGFDYMCFADPATGQLTVPRAVLDLVAPSGYLYFGTFSHIGHKVVERRLDFVGVNCTYNTYTK
ncbi:MAG: hypothetical protein SFX73_28900 [Kofleriaceae bacterium]|nr:hypothetical protein [Kofleriaceae bacterium]